MADGRQPRPSTDEERAPLLDSPEVQHPSFLERVTDVLQEPLTKLSKVLLILVLLLLLLSSIFIGLFAGSQHKRGVDRGHHETETTTLISTATATTTATSVQTATTTYVQTTTSIQTTTSVQVTTTIQTVTASLPLPPAPPKPNPTGHPEDELCFSADCIRLSADILSALDTSADPCEDFYEFSTGGWRKSHPLPADKGIYGQFNELSIQNQEVIREILKEDGAVPYSPSYDDQILKKLRGLYSSCMDEEKLNRIGMDPLIKVVDNIKRLFRGGSVGKKSDGDQETRKREGLTAALAFVHSRGVPALFDFDVDGDVGTDPNNMTLWFTQSSFGLPSKEYYKEDSIRNLYQGVVEDLLVMVSYEGDHKSKDTVLSTQDSSDNVWPPWPWPPWGGDDDGGGGKDRKPIDYAKLSREVVKFESKIAEASLDLDILFQDPIATYNPVPSWNLTRTLSQVLFGDYFATFTPRSFPERVIVTSPAYAAALSDILDSTSYQVVESYLITRTALALAPHLGTQSEAWLAARRLQEVLQGIKKGAVGERSEYCIGRVENTMGFAAGRYFANVTFGGESREKGTKVITNIIGAFKESLKELSWMDKNSSTAASEKADALRVKVGFPLSPNTTDARSIASYYYLVQIDRDTFFENMLSARMSDQYKKWQKLGKKRNPEEWEMYPSMVNAYFNPPANEIVFPAGILQSPFFDQNWPGYLSYGSFGHVASHELTHAFDSAGRLYNQQGKLEEWWTKNTSDAFQVKQDCIATQFSSYYVEDEDGNKVYVNGNLTSGENIGDTGLIQAWRAWKAQYDASWHAGNEYLLPGLDYTRDQMFFISFGRAWAQNIKPAAAVQRVRTDPHSPNKYRVDGTVYNIPEFAKAFNCSAKAKLNPPQEKRCILW